MANNNFRQNENGKFLDYNGEEYKVIPNTDDSYAVSRSGNVISLKYGRILSLKQADTNGYKYVAIRYSDNYKYQSVYIHRLVAQAFIPNPNNKLTVNHINENKGDNRVENLEWSTYSENLSYGSRARTVRNKLKEYYTTNRVGSTRCVAAMDSKGNTVYCFPSIDIAARYVGFAKYNSVKVQISNCVRGIAHNIYVAGYKWKTIDTDTLLEYYGSHPEFERDIKSMIIFLNNVREMEQKMRRENRDLMQFMSDSCNEFALKNSKVKIILAKDSSTGEIMGIYKNAAHALRVNDAENLNPSAVTRFIIEIKRHGVFSGYRWCRGMDTDLNNNPELYGTVLNDWKFSEPRTWHKK